MVIVIYRKEGLCVKFCPNCQYTVEDDSATFCPECGTTLQQKENNIPVGTVSIKKDVPPKNSNIPDRNMPPQGSGIPNRNLPPQGSGVPPMPNTMPPQNPNIPPMSNGYMPFIPNTPLMIDPYDHTAEFDPKDISDNKVIAMLVYLMGIVGVVIAALTGANNSPYVSFHIRQALKITVMETLTVICVALLCWTVLVPVAGGVFYLILVVVKIICFFGVCNNQAKEPPIIRSFKFLT